MPTDEEALCQGVGGGGKSLTTSRESGVRGLCHQSRCRKSKHTHARASFIWAVFRFSFVFTTFGFCDIFPPWTFTFCLPLTSLCILPSPPCIYSCIPLCILFCLSSFLFLAEPFYPPISCFCCSICPSLWKAKQHAHARTHTAEECRNDYAAELQKYNKEQNNHYYTDIPQLLNVRQTYS